MDGQPGKRQRDQELETRIRLIVALISLGYSAWMIWMIIPAHQRQLVRMRALAIARTATAKCARHAGVQAMRAELTTGAENYVLPYGLSWLRDGLGRAYDRARGAQ